MKTVKENFTWIKRAATKLSALMLATTCLGQGYGNLQYDRTTFVLSPSNLLSSNILSGSGISVTKGAGGRMTVSSLGAANVILMSNGVPFATNATIDFIPGTNVTIEASNLVTKATIRINSAGGGGGGETNRVSADHGVATNLLTYGMFTNLDTVWLQGVNIDSLIQAGPADMYLGWLYVSNNSQFFSNVTTFGTNESYYFKMPIGASSGKVLKADAAGNATWQNDEIGTNSPSSNLILTNTVFVSKNGDDATGTRGDASKPYATLTNAFPALQNGDTILIYPGEYVVLITNDFLALNLAKKTNVSIVGVGLPKIYGSNSPVGRLLTLSNCSNIRIEGLEMIGWGINYPTNDFTSVAINLDGDTGNKNVLIQNCIFRDWVRFGISRIDWATPTDEGIIIRDNYFSNIGATNLTGAVLADGAAIVVTWSNTKVEGNVIDNCFRGVEIYQDNTTIPIRNIQVLNNIITRSWGSSIILFNDKSYATNVADVTIANNTIRGGATQPYLADATPIDARSGINIDISHNHISDYELGGYGGIVISAVKAGAGRYNISGNTLHNLYESTNLASVGPGMYIHAGAAGGSNFSGAVIVGNIFSQICRQGLISSVNNAVIANNSFQNIGYAQVNVCPAIWLRVENAYNAMSNVLITGNIIADFMTNTTDTAFLIDCGVTNAVIQNNFVGPTIGLILSNNPCVSTNWGSNFWQYVYGPSSNDVMTLSEIATSTNDSWVTAYNTTSNRNYRIAVNDLLGGGLGGGDSITVNGTDTLDPDFNSTGIPTTNGVNVTWQTDGVNVTAYVQTNSATSAGVATAGTNGLDKVWKTDGSGVPGWRTDETGAGGSLTVLTNVTGVDAGIVGSETALEFLAGSNITIAGSNVVDTNRISISVVPGGSDTYAQFNDAGTLNGYKYLQMAPGGILKYTNTPGGRMEFIAGTITNYMDYSGIGSFNNNTFNLRQNNVVRYTLGDGGILRPDTAGSQGLGISSIPFSNVFTRVLDLDADGLIVRAPLAGHLALIASNNVLYALRSDGTLTNLQATGGGGSGTVTGPPTTVAGQLASYKGTDGTVITNSTKVTVTDDTLTASSIVSTNFSLYGVGSSTIEMNQANGGTNLILAVYESLVGNIYLRLPTNVASGVMWFATNGESTNIFSMIAPMGAPGQFLAYSNGVVLFTNAPSAGTGTPDGMLQIQTNGVQVNLAATNLEFVAASQMTITASNSGKTNYVFFSSTGSGGTGTNALFFFVTNGLSASNLSVRGDGGPGMIRITQGTNNGPSNFTFSIQADYKTNVTLLAMTNIAQGILWSQNLGDQTNRLQILGTNGGHDGKFLAFTNGTFDWAAAPGSGGGEANTASSLGTTNAATWSVFSNKVGVDLVFYSLTEGSGIDLVGTGASIQMGVTGNLVDWLGTATAITNEFAKDSELISATNGQWAIAGITNVFAKTNGPTIWNALLSSPILTNDLGLPQYDTDPNNGKLLLDTNTTLGPLLTYKWGDLLFYMLAATNLGTDNKIPKVNAGLIGFEDDGGGSGTPGGAAHMLQYNYNTAFEGTTNLFWDRTNYVLRLITTNVAGRLTLSDTNVAKYFAVQATNTIASNTVWTMPGQPLNGILGTSIVDPTNVTVMTYGTTGDGSVVLSNTPVIFKPTITDDLYVNGDFTNTGAIKTGDDLEVAENAYITGTFAVGSTSRFTNELISLSTITASNLNSIGGVNIAGSLSSLNASNVTLYSPNFRNSMTASNAYIKELDVTNLHFKAPTITPQAYYTTSNHYAIDCNQSEAIIVITNGVHFTNNVLNLPPAGEVAYVSFWFTNNTASSWALSFDSSLRRFAPATITNVVTLKACQICFKIVGAASGNGNAGYSYIVEQ